MPSRKKHEPASQDGGRLLEQLREANRELVAASLRAREQAEELEAARRQISSILESITDAFFALDHDWRFTYLNKEAERLLQRRREELMGKNVWDEFHDAVGSRFHHEYHRAVSERVTVAFEAFYPPLNLWVEVHAYPSPDGLSVYFHDITARRRTEQERERSARERAEMTAAAQRHAAESQAILDNMVDGVYVTDAEGRITLANQAGARLLGLADPGEVRIALAELPSLLHMRHPDGRPMSTGELALSRALAGVTVIQEDHVIRSPCTGRDAYVRASAAPIRDQSGRVVGAVAVARDVTELTELDRLKDEFISVAAHELKTPVAVMKGYAQMLLRKAGEVPPERGRMLAAIDRGADRIDRIVKDLLDISRLHLGQMRLANDRVNLPELVQEVVDRVAQGAPRHRLRLVNAEPVVVRGDRERLEQVLTNLLDNAVKYSPNGGEVDVDACVRDDEAVISVRDQGVGIPRGRQARIFERFYRAHTGTSYDYGGMGVGLYISREIVSRHGGRMWFESEEGHGTIFYFSLPL